MMELIFATFNRNKSIEIQALMPAAISVICLADIPGFEDIEETGITLRENAILKAETVYEKTGKPVFADDSGLMVDALNGRPGVYSARYAGEPSNSQANIDKLLKEMEGKENRNACFHTTIALIGFSGERMLFHGELNGTIATNPAGQSGFGYDPVFYPVGSTRTLAEYSLEEKNAISHRGIAVRSLLLYLNEYTRS